MKFLILALAAGLLYMLFKGDQKKKNIDSKQGDEKLKESGELVKDPMCGTYCRTDSDIRVREGDKVHVFCSYDCRDKFLRQLKQKAEKAEAAKEQTPEQTPEQPTKEPTEDTGDQSEPKSDA